MAFAGCWDAWMGSLTGWALWLGGSISVAMWMHATSGTAACIVGQLFWVSCVYEFQGIAAMYVCWLDCGLVLWKFLLSLVLGFERDEFLELVYRAQVV